MNKEQLQAELDKAKRQLDSATKMNMPQAAIDKAKSKIADFEDKIANYKEPVDEPAKPKKASKPVKKAKAPKAPKKKSKPSKPKKKVKKASKPVKKVKEVKKASKPVKKGKNKPVKAEKTVTFGGKTYTQKDKDFCDILRKKWNARKEAMAKSNKKYKTKTISEKVGEDVADAVTKTIQHAFDTQKKSIEKNPKAFVAKMERVENDADKFLNSLKSLLGSDYKSTQIKAEMAIIEKAIANIKAELKKHKK